MMAVRLICFREFSNNKRWGPSILKKRSGNNKFLESITLFVHKKNPQYNYHLSTQIFVISVFFF